MRACGWRNRLGTWCHRDRERCRYLIDILQHSIPPRDIKQRTDLLWAVVLVITLADLALQARPDLGSDSDTVSHLYRGHFVSDFDCLADDFMTDAKRKISLSPAAGYCVDVTSANSASILSPLLVGEDQLRGLPYDLDVDISITEWLGFELYKPLVLEQLGVDKYDK